MKKKFLIFAILMIFIFSAAGCGNYDFIDIKYNFDYAYILLPNGEVIEGTVDAWRDYEDGNQIQVTIDGTIYLTDTTRCVLISGGPNE